MLKPTPCPIRALVRPHKRGLATHGIASEQRRLILSSFLYYIISPCLYLSNWKHCLGFSNPPPLSPTGFPALRLSPIHWGFVYNRLDLIEDNKKLDIIIFLACITRGTLSVLNVLYIF